MKRNLYNSGMQRTVFTLLLLYLFAGATTAAEDIVDGLQLKYTFETGTTDLSGNGYDAILMGTATTGSNGDKTVLSMDGADGSYLDLGDSTTTGAMLASLSEFTICTWVYVNVNETWSRIFDFGSGTANYMFACTKGSSGNVRYAIKNGGSEQAIDGSAPLPIGKWSHMAITFSGTTAKLYINGVLDGINENMTISPLVLGAGNFTQNYIGKSQWPDPYFNGDITDFRIYNRELSSNELLTFIGYPAELLTVRETLDLGDLSEVASDISLPTSNGNVVIGWASSNETVIATNGSVTQPDKYTQTVVLTASLSMDGDTLKKSFIANVVAVNSSDVLIVNWNFEDDYLNFDNPEYVAVTDASESGFVGQTMNDAYIKTIGDTEQFNVLALGNGTGYFDMGTAVGDAIYSLGDYAMGVYFRIDEDYAALNSNGNFIWNFSNSDDVPTDQNGYIIGSLKEQSVSITPSWYKVNNQAVGKNENAPKGEWHHMAYVQNGTSGTVYIDGTMVVSGTISNLASVVLPQDSLSGTPYNWLGRSCYPADVFLRKTQLYGFKLYNMAATADDLDIVFGNEVYESISGMLTALNTAYDENPDAGFPEELNAEVANLELSGLEALITDMTLPIVGALDNTISITWATSNAAVLTAEGIVNRPKYINGDVTLIATLSKRGYKVNKIFKVKVLANEATKLSSDVIIHYNFDAALVNDTVVTAASEMAFVGTLKNGATVKPLGQEGLSNVYNVLSLNNDTSYFDMGEACGELIYGLGRYYSISAYFFIEGDKSNFESNGNFLYTFSNSDDLMTDQNGCMFGRATNGVFSLSSNYYASGDVSTAAATSAFALGNWHHMVFVQNDTLGTVWVDGEEISSISFSNLPISALAKDSLSGTKFNWLGRSPYIGDVNLGSALIYDFKVLSRSLSSTEVSVMSDVTPDLDWAYLASIDPDGVVKTEMGNVMVYSPSVGVITVKGLNQAVLIEIYDITGRLIKATKEQQVSVGTGLYLVKVNNSVTKVLVK